MGRWILLLVSPIIAVILFLAVGVGVAGAGMWGTPQAPSMAAVITLVLALIGFYAVVAFIGLGYYAAYFRKAVGNLELDGLRFEFEAHSMDWLKLFLGNVALVIGTLGIGIAFIGYRNWSFLIRHLGATGTVSLDRMTQSPTRVPREAEGLLDAFDMGAI